MSNSVRPHRRQPARLLRPWDSPGENTGVGCHFLLQCMKVKSESEVSQSCPTFRDPMDCSLPGSSVQGIFQARVLEWDAIAFSGFYSLLIVICILWFPNCAPGCSGKVQGTHRGAAGYFYFWRERQGYSSQPLSVSKGTGRQLTVDCWAVNGSNTEFARFFSRIKHHIFATLCHNDQQILMIKQSC